VLGVVPPKGGLLLFIRWVGGVIPHPHHHPKNKTTNPTTDRATTKTPTAKNHPKEREGGHEYTTLTTTDLRGRLTGKIWADRVVVILRLFSVV